MARSRKTPTSGTTTTLPPLAQPDRSERGVDEQTLFKIAEQRQLFQQAAAREKLTKVAAKKTRINESDNNSSDDDEDNEVPSLPPGVERVLEAMLWTTSLAMLHFTFDVLVQHQYGTEILWWQICQRAFSAWAVFLLLFYALHPRKSDETLLPGLPARYQSPLRQAIFFSMSVVSGCYLIYVTNMKGYLATQQRAPPLGCLWIWAVMELDLPWATLSLVLASAFIYLKGYTVK
ncbi:hypothetical protein LLEC1_02193 [Akanthomyces lecanii]|uniref:DUF7719 domain-containing protein n=1 Tax=Cordyceps confragosa TaxID=2714763 RepID=A0A179III2_CORDF|nr:hypothetical protein LLEC1_02193 [Akanthomyces lecanii]